MIVSREREKLINAIIYFARNTKHCHTLKLFKLLNFLDFEHYRLTGRTVTGLRYVAWPQGPAPNDLWHELQHGGGADLQKALAIVEIRDANPGRQLVRELKTRKEFDRKLFTKREFQIMERLSFLFDELKADDMSEFSHNKNLPWKKVFGKGEGKGKEIPPKLALESEPMIPELASLGADELQFRLDLLAGL